EPLNYGVDGCHHCKMTLMDRKFGGEVVSSKGKVFKFDDVNCMVNFLNSGELAESDVAYRMIVDFSKPEKLINAADALFIKSDKIKSPMASQVAAFENKADLDSHNEQWKGIFLSWGELITQYK